MSDFFHLVDLLGHMAAIIILLFFMYVLFSSRPRDDSDPPNGRSGVVVVTDAKTGMQYLKTSGGGITPRLDENGNHMRAGE